MGTHIKQHCFQKPNTKLGIVSFWWLVNSYELTIHNQFTILPLMELEPVSPQKVSGSNKKVFLKKCYLGGDIKSKKSVRQCTGQGTLEVMCSLWFTLHPPIYFYRLQGRYFGLYFIPMSNSVGFRTHKERGMISWLLIHLSLGLKKNKNI